MPVLALALPVGSHCRRQHGLGRRGRHLQPVPPAPAPLSPSWESYSLTATSTAEPYGSSYCTSISISASSLNPRAQAVTS